MYEETRKYFPLCEEAVSHTWLCNYSILNSLYMRKILFSFLSVYLYQKDEPEGVDPAGSGRADPRLTAQQTRGQGNPADSSLAIQKNLRVKNYL